jgi:hypothetical protein
MGVIDLLHKIKENGIAVTKFLHFASSYKESINLEYKLKIPSKYIY